MPENLCSNAVNAHVRQTFLGSHLNVGVEDITDQFTQPQFASELT